MTVKTVKIIKFSIISLFALILTVAATIGGIYYYGVKQDKQIEASGGVTLSPEKAQLGEEITATLLLKCPWHRKIIEAVAQVPQGTSLCAEPQITRSSIHWGYSIQAVTVKFKAYRTGNIPAGKLSVSFDRNTKNTEVNKDFIIPPFICTPLPLQKTQDVIIADAITPPKKLSRANTYLLIGIIVLVIILAIILIAQHYKKAKDIVLPLWMIALNDLSSLRDSIRAGKVSLDNGYTSLTDIVRGYLEKRFKLPASKQTTEEFLELMNRKNGPLPEVQRPFLKEFMQAAELVKFAKLPPDENALNQALSKAEALVNETRPPEDIESENLNKKGGK